LKKFVITGVSGYVAPRHLKAIKETDCDLIAAFDPHDSAGILDSYFPEAEYFNDYSRFERYVSKQNTGESKQIDYFSICSPNYVHDTQIRLGLNYGCNVICEKPLVLNPSNLDLLSILEEKSGKKVFTILQLRYHPSIVKLKEELNQISGKKYQVTLTYITPRGKWYYYSWKGEDEKSGGLATNIGIHLFDLLIYLFGNVKESFVYRRDSQKASGLIILNNAEVKWFLSIDKNDLPDSSKKSLRSIQIDGNEIEFSEGFTDLHTKVYWEILKGNGPGIEQARPSIETVYKIRFSELTNNLDLSHPLLKV